MPNTREKLIELLQCSPTDSFGNHGVGTLADHLIANGVTVQNWIPVTERLPEPGVWVLGVDKYGIEISVLQYQDWNDYWEAQYGEGCPGALISHWMPLPELPIELQEEE